MKPLLFVLAKSREFIVVNPQHVLYILEALSSADGESRSTVIMNDGKRFEVTGSVQNIYMSIR